MESPAAALPAIDAGDLAGKAFACLPDCGFCCTMQPELDAAEAAALRQRVTPLRVAHDPNGRMYLQLKGGCGACTLLERRACSQYDARPQHCRWFPFHLYFGETAEAYLNYSCRGVERRALGHLEGAFRETVLASADPGKVRREAADARATFAEFRRRAEAAGAWADPAPLVAEARREAAALFTRAGLERAARRAGERVGADALAEMALEPFAHPQPVSRPFYLDRRLRWLSFSRRGAGGLLPAEMDESGRFTPAGAAVAGLDRWQEPPPALAEALGAVLADRLLARAVFVGGVFERVDELDYEGSVAEAFHARLAETAAALAARARVVAALEPALASDPALLADEAHRFFDTEFLDQPTIGGFL